MRLFYNSHRFVPILLFSIIKAGESRATTILTSKLVELHLASIILPYIFHSLSSKQLAKALMEHETLNGEEVRKVIKGELIRSVEKMLEEESKPDSS